MEAQKQSQLEAHDYSHICLQNRRTWARVLAHRKFLQFASKYVMCKEETVMLGVVVSSLGQDHVFLLCVDIIYNSEAQFPD